MRAFTAKDAKNLRGAASTYPPSEFFDVGKALTSLGTGEAVVSVLSPKGIPTATAAVQILAPSSSMSALDDTGYQQVLAASQIARKYATPIDRDSAHEILARKIGQAATPAAASAAPSGGVLNDMMSNPIAKSVIRAATTQAARTVTTQIVRGIFGMLKGR